MDRVLAGVTMLLAGFVFVAGARSVPKAGRDAALRLLIVGGLVILLGIVVGAGIRFHDRSGLSPGTVVFFVGVSLMAASIIWNEVRNRGNT